MSTDKPIAGVRRPLTGDELDRILSGIAGASSTGDLYTGLIRTLYNALLADAGYTLDTLPDGQRINPADYTIPSSQWAAIVTAATNRADQWGTGPHLSLDLINTMPSTYDDPTVPEPHLHLTDHRPDEHVLHVSREAVDTITACTAHVEELARQYGADSEIHRRAEQSWLRHLSGLFRMSLGADTTVARDGPLSLLVATGSGFTYGVIFHDEVRRCTVAGCGAAIPDAAGPPASDHEHVPSYPVGGPQPGQWQVHS